MAKRELDEPNSALAPADEAAWRGDEHRIKVAAAQEAGLDVGQEEIDLYTAGFKAGMTLSDPADKAIVFRGRTVLDTAEMSASLKPLFRFLKLSQEFVALRVHDGEFELRIAGNAAEQAKPTMDSAKVALQLWVGAGFLGLFAYQWVEWLAGILWGLGLLVGGWTLRQGLVSGRALLAARIAVGLGMLAREEQLVLPPAARAP